MKKRSRLEKLGGPLHPSFPPVRPCASYAAGAFEGDREADGLGPISGGNVAMSARESKS